MKYQIQDPEVLMLATIAGMLKGDYVREGPDDPWAGSPFAWIRTRPSGEVGKICEQLVAGWCAAKGSMLREAQTRMQTGSLPGNASRSSSPRSGRAASTSSNSSEIRTTSSPSVLVFRHSMRIAGSSPRPCSGSTSLAILRSTPARVAPTPSGFPLTHRVPTRGLRPAAVASRMRTTSCGSGRRSGDGMAPHNRLQRTVGRSARR